MCLYSHFAQITSFAIYCPLSPGHLHWPRLVINALQLDRLPKQVVFDWLLPEKAVGLARCCRQAICASYWLSCHLLITDWLPLTTDTCSLCAFWLARLRFKVDFDWKVNDVSVSSLRKEGAVAFYHWWIYCLVIVAQNCLHSCVSQLGMFWVTRDSAVIRSKEIYAEVPIMRLKHELEFLRLENFRAYIQLQEILYGIKLNNNTGP